MRVVPVTVNSATTSLSSFEIAAAIRAAVVAVSAKVVVALALLWGRRGGILACVFKIC